MRSRRSQAGPREPFPDCRLGELEVVSPLLVAIESALQRITEDVAIDHLAAAIGIIDAKFAPAQPQITDLAVANKGVVLLGAGRAGQPQGDVAIALVEFRGRKRHCTALGSSTLTP